MADNTAAELRAELEAAHGAYMAELKQAGAAWETKPAAGGEGEEGWSARQVAEHISGANLFFGAGIAQAIGVTAPAMGRAELATAADAVTKTTETHAVLVGVVGQVKDAQLGMEIDHPRLGKQTLGGIIGVVTYHYNDHANQLKTLRG